MKIFTSILIAVLLIFTLPAFSADVGYSDYGAYVPYLVDTPAELIPAGSGDMTEYKTRAHWRSPSGYLVFANSSDAIVNHGVLPFKVGWRSLTL